MAISKFMFVLVFVLLTKCSVIATPVGNEPSWGFSTLPEAVQDHIMELIPHPESTKLIQQVSTQWLKHKDLLDYRAGLLLDGGERTLFEAAVSAIDLNRADRFLILLTAPALKSQWRFSLLNTALNSCIMKHRREISQMILTHRPDVMVPQLLEGQSALQVSRKKQLIVSSTVLLINYASLPMIQDFLERGLLPVNFWNGLPLKTAIRLNNMDMLTLFLRYGADPNMDNGKIITICIQKNRLEMLKVLIANRADIHRDGEQPLFVAIQSKRYHILNYLIHEQNVNIEVSLSWPLRLAMKSGDLKLIRFIAEYTSISGRTLALIEGIESRVDWEILKTFIFEFRIPLISSQNEPLLAAIRTSQSHIVKWFLQHGVSPDCQPTEGRLSRSVYVACVYQSDPVILQILKEHGCNLHSLHELPLRTAVIGGHLQIVEYLLKDGADIHVRDEECLREAVSQDNTRMVQLLLEHGANASYQQGDLLLQAIHSGHTGIAQLLIQLGGVSPVDNEKKLLVPAVDLGDEKLVKLLLNAGARGSALQNSLVFSAASMGYTKILELLHDHGGNIRYQEDEALMLACQHGHTETVKYLLKKGALPTAQSGRAFQLAKQYPDILSLLHLNSI